MSFDGTDDYIQTSYTPSGDWSTSLWFNTGDMTSLRGIFSSVDNDGTRNGVQVRLRDSPDSDLNVYFLLVVQQHNAIAVFYLFLQIII